MNILVENTEYKSILPSMTSDTSPSPYSVTCSTTTINKPFKALDGDTETYLRTNINTACPVTIVMDTGSEDTEVVTGYRLNCKYNTTWTINSWTFEASNDNSTWTILDTRSNITWATYPIQNFVFENTTKYRYYRLNISKKNGNNSICINELNLLHECSDTRLSFKKILKDNLPSIQLTGEDTIYITEKGNMYITDKHGKLVPIGGQSSSGSTSISEEAGNAITTKPDGIYVEDKTSEIDTLSDRMQKISIAQHTVNGETEHCNLKLSDTFYTPVAGQYIPFTISEGNMTSSTASLVNLSGGKTYSISIALAYQGASTVASIYYTLNNVTTGEIIRGFQPFGGNNQFEFPYTLVFEYTPKEDCEIGWYVDSTWQSDTIIDTFTIWSIHEIGRMLTVDPVEHINVETGIEDTPVGTIIPFIGTTAPKHYLMCDNSEYNISEYKDLAQHFIDQFGKANIFGGDGETTFAVPKYECKYTSVIPAMQSDIQDGYEVSASSVYTVGNTFPAWKAFNKTMVDAYDSWASASGTTTGWLQVKMPYRTRINRFSLTARYDPRQSTTITYFDDFNLCGSNDGTTWTTLKTVTGETGWGSAVTKTYDVDNSPCYMYYRINFTKISNTPQYVDVAMFDLYAIESMKAIKYEPTYFMKNTYNADNVYSTDEIIVGRWIDGKPLYRKTLDCGALPNTTTKVVAHGVENIDQVVKMSGVATNTSTGLTMALPHISTTAGSQVMLACTPEAVRISAGINLTAYSTSYVTLEYTKQGEGSSDAGKYQNVDYTDDEVHT